MRTGEGVDGRENEVCTPVQEREKEEMQYWEMGRGTEGDARAGEMLQMGDMLQGGKVAVIRGRVGLGLGVVDVG